MFSAIFIDRPRLATVIAIVTTIAGLLSLLVIPIAQYPALSCRRRCRLPRRIPEKRRRRRVLPSRNRSRARSLASTR